MNVFANTKSRINPKSILGGLGFFDEADFERETSVVSTVSKGVGEVVEAVFSLGQDVTGVESKNETNGDGQFPSTGSIEFNAEAAQKKKAETESKKAFFQALKEDQDRAQRSKEKLLFEEEINDIVTNLPTEQKNQLLHYQLNYRDRSIYQRAALRNKLIEQRKQTEKQQKQAAIPSPAKQPSAMEGIFEGRSGTQGGGTANLSVQAVG